MMNRKHGSIALVCVAALASGQASGQDVEAGRRVFSQCAACHSTDGSNTLGPSLRGVMGRVAGSYPGFRFSRAIKGAGYAWDGMTMDAYIASPQAAIPGNLMPFAGIPDARQRADLIAYLATLH